MRFTHRHRPIVLSVFMIGYNLHLEAFTNENVKKKGFASLWSEPSQCARGHLADVSRHWPVHSCAWTEVGPMAFAHRVTIRHTVMHLKNVTKRMVNPKHENPSKFNDIK